MASINSNNDFILSNSDKLAFGGSSPSSSSMPSNLNSFNSQSGITNNNTSFSYNNDSNHGLPSRPFSKLPEFTSKNWNVPDQFKNKSLDDQISYLEHEYNRLHKRYAETLSLRQGPVANFFSGDLNAQVEAHANSYKNERDAIFKLLTEARNQRINYYSNLNTELNKYNIEAEALKRQGITNKYYLLKNGPIGNAGANLTTGNYGAINPQIEKRKKRDNSFLKWILGLITLGILK